jgi:putative heme-binding domain-containing protein
MTHPPLFRIAIVAFLVSTLMEAAEPPVKEGLVLWLDASAQGPARQAAALPPIRHLQPIDLLLDSSGLSRHAVQLSADRRPQFTSDSEVAYLLFDGKDDFLAVSMGRTLTPEATVFVVAAPKANPGNFSALFGAAETAKNDYTSGLNIDFGPAGTADLSVVNVESAGTSGARDLLVPGLLNAAERPLGDFHIFTVRSKIGKTGNELFLDGFKGGDRERLESNIGLDQMIIGARLFSNDATQPPFAQGFLQGAIAEVLVYNRALTDEERRKVEESLGTRMVKLQGLLRGAKGHALETVKDPPLVQMLVPGFTVDELPLKIGNINNIRYRRDGKVVALGYDGRIHLLSDANGDGLEDTAEFYWDQKTMRGPIGMALTPKGDPRGDGVFVASKGKVSFFPDSNGDNRADEEKIVASGWQESFHGVDTTGLALDPKDGSIYFGMGCANFGDAYQIDRATGRSTYKLDSIRGTIQRVSPDFAQKETICTGVRFTCALAFNRLGDLFASEQEGATWLANGNPLDELLHIQRDKHYGFPPRHPKHLPNVIDEPAVYEYGPQHQSTVGMVFNEGVNGGPSFGPAHWNGDALVCGESRGKLYRTKLAKTPLGYVAQNHLIGCFNLLLVDACVTPQGDLLVACHSGPPDWGTGPAGDGRLFKIRYTGRNLPQPVTAWAAGPDEFRIAFDRPLNSQEWSTAKAGVRIEAGTFVSAGDRFETVRPGYQVVRDQMATPRRWVEPLGLSLNADQRTLVLRVPRQAEAVGYAITLPLPPNWIQKDGLRQAPEMDLQVTMNGIAAEVRGGPATILPHTSLAVSRHFTEGSAEHSAFFAAALIPGSEVIVRGSVDPSNPYVPAVQPGSRLDWDPQSDPFTAAVFKVRDELGSKNVPIEDGHAGKLKALGTYTLTNPADPASGLSLAHANFKHVLNPQRLFVPWAAEKSANEELAPGVVKVRDDVKGRWLHGRRLFFGEAACFTCHTIRGEGMAFGPDLTNLIHRDRGSVLQDILNPSATINPDQAGSLVKLTDGANVTGIVRADAGGKVVKVAMQGGAEIELARDKIEAIEPLKISLMPEDFTKRLSAEQQEDLLTFLLVNPLEPAPITRMDPPAPPPRKRAEIAEFVSPVTAPVSAVKPLRILLSAGEKDHGVDEHDYPLWLERWSKLLALGDGVTVTKCMNFPTAEQLAAADVTVFYSRNVGWDANAAPLLDEYQRRGGGLVYIHFAIEGGKHALPLAERIGLAFSFSKFRHGQMDLTFPDPKHPITRGFEQVQFIDETYWSLRGDPKRVAVLANSIEENAPQPQLWTLERMQGRVFGCIPGHYSWTFDDPLFRVLILRGICWAAKQDDVDRLGELAFVGARVQ